MTEEKGERSTLQGTVTKIVYQDPQGRYTVARLEVDRSQTVTVVGEIYPVSEGEEIKVGGQWRVHPRYGLQFQAEWWEKVEPATLEGIERYLGSGLIRGIGPTYARRLVSAFGLDTLRVLSEEPQRILEVQGIGKIRAQRILHAWEEQKGMRDVMVFLQGHGVGSSLALRIYRAFGAETVVKVKENPYCLAQEIYGVGFVLADRIARSMGIGSDSPLRVQAGLLHVLRKFSDEGHCFVPQALVKSNASALLGVEAEATESAVKKLSREGEIVLEEAGDEGATRVYPQELYHAESRVASAIRNLLSTPSGLKEKRFQGFRDKGEQAMGHLFNPLTLEPLNSSTFVLEEEQREAILQALQRKVLVITGGPGTGKTTLLISLLAILRASRVSFALAAPTGRAAKRMSEMAGEEAKTIHRLLEYSPRERRFQRGENSPVDAEVVIVDEASMLDLPLMDHLLRAVEPHSHLVFLGDVDQLPSVGPGSVLRDLIGSGVVPVVVLRRIFRQSRESFIVVNAHRILQGQPLLFGDDRDKRDFVFVPRENEEEILETVKTLVKKGLRDNEIQVLTPVHRGLLGTVHLNRELQKLVNPNEECIERGEILFRLGDKVMQLRNNYDKAVFNGDLGRIVRIDKDGEELQVDFDGRAVPYPFDELDELSLAYAISIHKSQGSEYPAVVVPLHTSHYVMLHRSILYTAVTRGKEMVILVGSKRALSIALRNVRVERRYTGLKEKLIT
ncbi:MAG: ATP-dependent RecD-like DNA helicase [Deltaproteobacteria bacterium]|nr:ATP-dependent RecD-like DNA helicase [Deltaproteobacteria bacterium]